MGPLFCREECWNMWGQAALGSPPGEARSLPANPPSLNHSPHKMRQKRKHQQHKYPAHPNQKIQGHLRIVNLFFLHTLTLAICRPPTHRVQTVLVP